MGNTKSLLSPSCSAPTETISPLKKPDDITIESICDFHGCLLFSVPLELVRLIASFMDLSTLSRFSQVSKKLRNVCLADELWKNVYEKEYHFLVKRPSTLPNSGSSYEVASPVESSFGFGIRNVIYTIDLSSFRRREFESHIQAMKRLRVQICCSCRQAPSTHFFDFIFRGMCSRCAVTASHLLMDLQRKNIEKKRQHENNDNPEHLLTLKLLRELVWKFPLRWRFHGAEAPRKFFLLFDSDSHGNSMRMLDYRCAEYFPLILLIRAQKKFRQPSAEKSELKNAEPFTFETEVLLGAFIACPLRKHDRKYFGNSSCFIFSLPLSESVSNEPPFQIHYPASSSTSSSSSSSYSSQSRSHSSSSKKREEEPKPVDEPGNFVFFDGAKLGFGGNHSLFGLSLDSDLIHGETWPDLTYHSNGLLSGIEQLLNVEMDDTIHFRSSRVQMWTYQPAEKQYLFKQEDTESALNNGVNRMMVEFSRFSKPYSQLLDTN